MSAAFNPNEAHACIVEAMREVIRRSPDLEDMGLCVRASEDTLRRMRDPAQRQPEDAWTIPRLARFISYEQRTLKTNRLALKLLDVMHDHDEHALPVEMRSLVRHCRAIAAQLSAMVAAILADTEHDSIDPRERSDLKSRVSDLRSGLADLSDELDAVHPVSSGRLRVGG